jgi:hypothetical protein
MVCLNRKALSGGYSSSGSFFWSLHCPASCDGVVEDVGSRKDGYIAN